MRTLAVLASVLVMSGCPAEENTTAQAPAPPAPLAVAPVAKKKPVDPKQAEASVVGQQVDSLQTEWFQGEANGVEGTQLVVFFEVWCPHCRREAPRLQELYETLDDKGLEVVALTKLSRGVTEDQLAEFIKDNGMTYPVGRAPDTLARQLNVRGIPAAAVLKDGKVVWRGHPARLDESALAKWL